MNRTRSFIFSPLGPALGRRLGAGRTAARLELPGSELLGFASPCHSPAAEENISICSLQVLYGSATCPEKAVLPPQEGQDVGPLFQLPVASGVEQAVSVLSDLMSTCLCKFRVLLMGAGFLDVLLL